MHLSVFDHSVLMPFFVRGEDAKVDAKRTFFIKECAKVVLMKFVFFSQVS